MGRGHALVIYAFQHTRVVEHCTLYAYTVLERLIDFSFLSPVVVVFVVGMRQECEWGKWWRKLL